MKKIKGFTLIELLAIIVILGIIALITVPTVKKIMDDAKKKVFMNSAYGIIKAGDLYYSRKDMLDETIEEKIFTFPNSAEELEMDGKLPEEGTMIINEDGDIGIAISNGEYCVKKGYNDKDITITDDYKRCHNPEIPLKLSEIVTTSKVITSIPSCITDGTTCSSGTPMALEVNDDEIYNFYVMSETAGEVTLIMDRNLGDNVEWITSEDYATANTDSTSCSYTSCSDKGPLTAVNALKERTSGWTNIPMREYTYSDDGGGNKYTAFSIKMRARMITFIEINNIKTTNNEKIPSWLYDNLDTNLAYGYWTSAVYPANHDHAYNIICGGGVSHNGVSVNDIGLRAVIKLSK